MVLFYSETSYGSRVGFKLFSALQYPFERLNAIDVAASTTKIQVFRLSYFKLQVCRVQSHHILPPPSFSRIIARPLSRKLISYLLSSQWYHFVRIGGITSVPMMAYLFTLDISSLPGWCDGDANKLAEPATAAVLTTPNS